MFELTAQMIFLIVFLGLMAVYLWVDREKFERHGIFLIRRTEKGIGTIEKVAEKFPRFWNIYGWAATALGAISIVGAGLAIGQIVFKVFSTGSTSGGPSLLLPGLVSENQFQAGASFVPVEYWVISIMVIVTVHELSHGLIAKAEGMEINSIGYGVLGVIPIGFVEPEGEDMLSGEISDGEIWSGGDWKSKIKVLSAGSFANYLTALVFLVLAIGSTQALTQSSDLFYNAEEGFPAAEAGMENGTLFSINGTAVESTKDLKRVTENLSVGDQVTLSTSEGNYSFLTTEKEDFDGGYMGIRVGKTQVIKESYSSSQGFFQWFISLLNTVFLLNIMIGLFNMLPIKPLDGGLIAETLFEEFTDEKNIDRFNKFSLASWALLLTLIILSVIGL